MNTFYTGTSSFPHYKRFADNRDAFRNDNCEATKQFAKLRFNIDIEASKKTNMMKDIEVHETGEAHDRRQEAIARQRREDLHSTQKMNLKLNATVKARNNAERQEWLNEKNKIQTSLKSKEEDDLVENTRSTMRKAAVMDMFHVNIDG